VLVVKVRNRTLLALSVVLLATAVALGTLLVHDGEVGSSADLEEGGAVRIKAALRPVTGNEWTRAAAIPAEFFDNYTYVVEGDDPSVLMLLTTPDAQDLEGRVVVAGTVVALTVWHGINVVVVDSSSVTDPVVFG